MVRRYLTNYAACVAEKCLAWRTGCSFKHRSSWSPCGSG